MKDKNFLLQNALILAPMAGVTDVGFRAVACQHGADATCSEMLSCRAMLSNPKKTKFMTICTDAEKIKIGQIFGHEPDIMANSLSLSMLEQYDIIDINMGCPAPKILKNNEGSALMKNLPLASKIISACARASDKPISVKFRLGVDGDNSLEFGRMCQESGAAFVTLHARTTSQGYSGKADYDAIARLKAGVQIPVIGNGDVVDKESLTKMRQTGVDAVMIGRGALGKPWIFDLLKNKKEPKNKFDIIKQHIEILQKYYDEKWITLYIRKHLLWYLNGVKGASEMRGQIATSDDIQKSLEILKQAIK